MDETTAMLRIWRSMIRRCHEPSADRFPDYGGRGIAVCDAWRASFLQFRADVGERPSRAHSLERKDNDLGYNPSNVRWATAREQARNRRDNRPLTARGETLLLVEWCERTGIPKSTFINRLARGMSMEAAIAAGRPADIGWPRDGTRRCRAAGVKPPSVRYHMQCGMNFEEAVARMLTREVA